MKTSVVLLLAGAMLLLAGRTVLAQSSDPIGLNALLAVNPALTGSGVPVAQAEALFGGDDSYEVNPSYVGQPSGLFIYTGTDGSTAVGFPNDVGAESGHADSVGDEFYGTNGGVAPGVSAVYNYEADYFANDIVNDLAPIPARIVNQSYIFSGATVPEQEQIDEVFDTYAATYNTLFVSGVGNGGGINSPASCYNGIGVAAYGGGSSTGPTYDGRSKPDITAPASETSFSTPLVAGAATLLLQAAGDGDGGAGTASAASDSRVLKALLLNGAVKPAGWSNTPTAPLDPNYGAGILNVYNSYENLVAGEYGSSAATSGSVGAVSSGPVLPAEGWDFASITTGLSGSNYINESNHYLFDLSASTGTDFTLTSTLTWWRQANQSSINNLNLYLFDATTGDMLDVSDSTIDNVQELYVTGLAPGDYDLVVEKAGGTSTNTGGSVVSASETYAVAFNFSPVPEPSVAWLAGTGLAGLAVMRRRRVF